MVLSLLGVTDGIQQFFANVFQGNSVLATIIISMIPMIELKGGIVFGMSEQFWGANTLTVWEAYGCGVAGGFVVTVILTFLLKPVFAWLKNTKLFQKLVLRLEKSFKKKAQKIDGDNKKSAIKKMLGVFCFIAIPLPLTGVWTGTAIAVFLDLKWWQSLLCALVGNAVAGAIIALVGVALIEWLDIVFYVILAIAAILIIAAIIKMIIDSKKEKAAALAQESDDSVDDKAE